MQRLVDAKEYCALRVQWCGVAAEVRSSRCDDIGRSELEDERGCADDAGRVVVARTVAHRTRNSCRIESQPAAFRTTTEATWPAGQR